EMGERFFVEGDRIEAISGHRARLQTVRDRVPGKAGVVLLAAESLLLRCRHDFAVLHQSGRRVVKVGAQAQNVHGFAPAVSWLALACLAARISAMGRCSRANIACAMRAEPSSLVCTTSSMTAASAGSSA